MSSPSPETVIKYANALGRALSMANAAERRDQLLAAMASDGCSTTAANFRHGSDYLIAEGLATKTRPRNDTRNRGKGDGKRGPLCYVFELTVAGRAYFTGPAFVTTVPPSAVLGDCFPPPVV